MRKDKNIKPYKMDRNFKGLDLGSRAVVNIGGTRKSPGLRELVDILNKTLKVKEDENNKK